ncbi:MAG TPA: tRNA (guanosine(37)-N1)-methyltransferase TrmD [Saprospiraceae bacterium]|nr:tRNA (guanosine(37)-N1)-methyltransferase TrmD [Saprospiraceae bacterium]
MLEIDILAVVPGLLEGPFSHSILQRAADKNLLKVRVIDLRTFGIGSYHQIDDNAFGGGAGMVLMAQPLADAIRKLQAEGAYDEIIYLTPDGTTLNQSLANKLSLRSRLLLICGHYKGIDERIREKFVTMEISIGDYVLSGGELAAAVLVDAIGRLIPGVLNDGTSALTDSFQDDLLAPPVYTRPADWEGMKVPEILLSGHEAKIEEWRYQQSLQRTMARRPDILKDGEEI